MYKYWNSIRKNTLLLGLFLGLLVCIAIVLGFFGALVYFKEYSIWFIMIIIGVFAYKLGYKDGFSSVKIPLQNRNLPPGTIKNLSEKILTALKERKNN